MQTICALILFAPLRVILLPHARQRFLFAVLFIAGFCFTNLYMSKMASILTAAGGLDQINTLQDLIDAKLTVMMLDFEYDMLVERKFNTDFLQVVYPVNKTILDLHRESMNTSYAYSVSTDRWDFINNQQVHLRTPIFRLTPICIGPFYHIFALQKDSYLKQPLKDFILAVSQSGFLEFWKDEAFYDALFLGYVHVMKTYHEVKPLTMNFFSSILYVWLAGMFLGLLTFIWEVKGNHMLHICRRQFENIIEKRNAMKI